MKRVFIKNLFGIVVFSVRFDSESPTRSTEHVAFRCHICNALLLQNRSGFIVTLEQIVNKNLKLLTHRDAHPALYFGANRRKLIELQSASVDVTKSLCDARPHAAGCSLFYVMFVLFGSIKNWIVFSY